MSTEDAREKAIEAADALLANQNEPATVTPDNTAPEDTKPQGTPPKGDSEKVWEEKYKVLQGKYNAETKRLNERITQLESAPVDTGQVQEIAALKQQVSELQQQLSQASTPEANTGKMDDDLKYIAENYDPDLAERLSNMINRQSSGDLDALKEQVSSMQQTTQESIQQARVDALTAALKKDGIDWEQVDNDPMFHDWLSQEEGQTGTPRLNFMRTHFANGDIARTAYFYRAFKAQERSNFDKNPLNEHVTPQTTNSAPEINTSDEVWTQANIQALYRDRQNGRLSEEDFRKYEQDLERAIAEGRVEA